MKIECLTLVSVDLFSRFFEKFSTVWMPKALAVLNSLLSIPFVPEVLIALGVSALILSVIIQDERLDGAIIATLMGMAVIVLIFVFTMRFSGGVG